MGKVIRNQLVKTSRIEQKGSGIRHRPKASSIENKYRVSTSSNHDATSLGSTIKTKPKTSTSGKPATTTTAATSADNKTTFPRR